MKRAALLFALSGLVAGCAPVPTSPSPPAAEGGAPGGPPETRPPSPAASAPSAPPRVPPTPAEVQQAEALEIGRAHV